jgi:hypothetical protein
MTNLKDGEPCDSEDKLLPCPFCGGAASRTVSYQILRVGCENCLLYFSNHVRFGCTSDGDWNTRASS